MLRTFDPIKHHFLSVDFLSAQNQIRAYRPKKYSSTVMSDTDGVRFNWNVFPSTRLEASRLSTPVGCLYTPFGTTVSAQIHGNPLICSCGNYINPYIKLDRLNWMWWCPFCESRNPLPQDYAIPESSYTEEDWPIELQQSSHTVEYLLPEDVSTQIHPDLPTAYTLILDAYEYLNDTSFQQLKLVLLELIDELPNGSLVMILSYDLTVSVHKSLGSPTVFGPDNLEMFTTRSVETVLAHLDVSKELPYEYSDSSLVQQGYFMEISPSSKESIKQLINNISPVTIDSSRVPRASGLAHYISTIALSQSSYRNFVGKTFHFASGACSVGPGKIFDCTSNEMIRSHKDILDLNARHFSSARKFYDALSKIANGQNIEDALYVSQLVSAKTTHRYTAEQAPIWTVSVITGSPDQVGCYEMKPLVGGTLGHFHLLEYFDQLRLPDALKKSLTGVFKNRVRVTTSSKLKISRLVGGGGYDLPSSYRNNPVIYHDKIADTLDEFDNSVSKKNFTNQWQFNSLLSMDTVCFLLEMVTVRSLLDLPLAPKEVFLQILHRFFDKGWKLRVSTIKKPTTASFKSAILREHGLISNFDQHVYINILSRLLISKIDTTLGFDTFDNMVKLLDNTIIKVLKHFGGISATSNISLSSNPYLNFGDAYQLSEGLHEIPLLAYNLRRSPLVKIFNSSPDETAMHQSWFSVLNLEDSLEAILPKLYLVENSSNGIAKEVPLESDTLKMTEGDNSFLAMDSVFQRVIYANFPLKLHSSNNDELLLQRNERILPAIKFFELRRPTGVAPRYVVTCGGHSQARFLLARLNPVDKVEEQSKKWGLFRRTDYNSIMTDDVSLRQYYDGLVKMVKNYRE